MDDSLKKARDYVLVENTAQAVFRHLDRLQDHRATFGTRWIWELLQNARDAAPADGVVIDIRLTEHELYFRHDGKAFASGEIAHLIYHGSTKVDVEESVGHLGSGFLSTHLLSPAVRVCGQLDDGRPFDFALDRSGATVEELRQAMDRSWDSFEQSVEKAKVDDGSHPTEFVYGLDDDAVSVARAGIGHLRRLGALVIAFSPEIKGILIVDTSETWKIARGPREPLADNLEMLHVECEKNGEATSRSVVIAGGMDDVQAARWFRPHLGSPRTWTSILPGFSSSSPYLAPRGLRSRLWSTVDSSSHVRTATGSCLMAILMASGRTGGCSVSVCVTWETYWNTSLGQGWVVPSVCLLSMALACRTGSIPSGSHTTSGVSWSGPDRSP